MMEKKQARILQYFQGHSVEKGQHIQSLSSSYHRGREHCLSLYIFQDIFFFFSMGNPEVKSSLNWFSFETKVTAETKYQPDNKNSCTCTHSTVVSFFTSGACMYPQLPTKNMQALPFLLLRGKVVHISAILHSTLAYMLKQKHHSPKKHSSMSMNNLCENQKTFLTCGKMHTAAAKFTSPCHELVNGSWQRK